MTLGIGTVAEVLVAMSLSKVWLFNCGCVHGATPAVKVGNISKEEDA